MLKLKAILDREIFLYILAVILCCLFLIWVLQLWNADLRIPFDYHWDTLMTGASIKGMIDNGWYATNSFIGAPYGFQYYDFASNVNLDMGIMKLISLVFPNWAETLNIYFLLTFPLVTVTSLYVFRKLNVSKITSLVGSLLFTFLPFHFMQGEPHINLAAYYMIPLVVLVCLWLFEDNFTLKVITNDHDAITKQIPKDNDQNPSPSSSLSITMGEGKGEGDSSEVVSPRSLLPRVEKTNTRRTINWRGMGAISICFLVGSTFIYYPFFACFFLLIAGCGVALTRKKVQPLINSGVLICTIVLFVVINSLPSLIYQFQNGANLLLSRDPAETEIFGLKIVELIFPVWGNQNPFLAAIADKYQYTAPIINENKSAALGLVGSIGFFILLITLFFRFFRPNTGNTPVVFKRLSEIGILNAAAILLGTVGGLGTIIAYLFFPQIRTYTRISVFIAFFAILAIVWMVDYLLKKTTFSKITITTLMVAVLVVGIRDQTSSEFVPEYQQIKQEYINDANFVKHIESAYPDNNLVFQLPYNAFPESRPPYKMQFYDLFRGYLHSTSINWSYGTMKGRYGDFWEKGIAEKPVEEMVESLSLSGFNGIYLDSYGYKEKGKEITGSLSSILDVTPLISDNGRLYFFDMTPYNDKLKSQYSIEEYNNQKTQVLNPIYYEFRDGFSLIDHNESIRLCKASGIIVLANFTDEPMTITLGATFETGYSEMSDLIITSSILNDKVRINNAGVDYTKDIIVPPGRYEIKLTCDAKGTYVEGKYLSTVFAVLNFEVIEHD